ncbi:MAG: PEP-CTERM sorting domain-containing protein [Akkermansiaceae bacterium]
MKAFQYTCVVLIPLTVLPLRAATVAISGTNTDLGPSTPLSVTFEDLFINASASTPTATSFSFSGSTFDINFQEFATSTPTIASGSVSSVSILDSTDVSAGGNDLFVISSETFPGGEIVDIVFIDFDNLVFDAFQISNELPAFSSFENNLILTDFSYNGSVDTYTINQSGSLVIPEPTTGLLFTCGGIALIISRRRTRHRFQSMTRA